MVVIVSDELNQHLLPKTNTIELIVKGKTTSKHIKMEMLFNSVTGDVPAGVRIFTAICRVQDREKQCARLLAFLPGFCEFTQIAAKQAKRVCFGRACTQSRSRLFWLEPIGSLQCRPRSCSCISAIPSISCFGIRSSSHSVCKSWRHRSSS